MMRKMLRSITVMTLLLAFLPQVYAQFEPPAGQPGSHAMHADSTVFIDWASGCTVTRSWVDISDTTLGLVTHGSDSAGMGKADDGVVSLGDGGWAVLTFNNPIVDGPGYDFAVFENAFADAYLELGFVEVSSDGVNYYRFPSVSLTDTVTQVTGFDTLDATKIDRLAGKYRAMYGMPFDLADLAMMSGLNPNNVTHVRIMDVIGALDPQWMTRDSQGHPINEPFPTPWASGGFDLDAVGVINNTINAGLGNPLLPALKVWPNPSSDLLFFNAEQEITTVVVFDYTGRRIVLDVHGTHLIDISRLAPGLYTGRASGNNGRGVYSFRFIRQ